MTIKIGYALKGSNKVRNLAPGEYATEIQAKAEIMKRNRETPLAPRLERVVVIVED